MEERFIHNTMTRATIFHASDEEEARILISQLLYRLLLPLYIRKIANKTKPDIVLCMADTFNGLVVLSCMGLKLKVFIGDVTKPDLNFALSTKIMKRLFYPYASGFIAQTKSAARFLSRKSLAVGSISK
jgi:hypothetical protein